MTSNGKHPRKTPRTTSHVPRAEPTPDEGDGSTHGGDDASTGRTEPQIEPAVSPVGNGRTPTGQFGPNNRFGKGNPNARKVHELRMDFLNAIDPRTLPALARRLQAQALQGDMDSIKLLIDHTLGRPAQAVALTDADGGPLGFNFHQVTAIVLDALADDPAKRVEVASRLMELDDDARDARP